MSRNKGLLYAFAPWKDGFILKQACKARDRNMKNGCKICPAFRHIAMKKGPAAQYCRPEPVDKPHGRLGGPQTRNLNRRSGHCRGQPSFRLISSGSLCPSGNGPRGHRFPPSTSKCNPAPATCAVGPEALRSKVSLQGSPAGAKGSGCPVGTTAEGS